MSLGKGVLWFLAQMVTTTVSWIRPVRVPAQTNTSRTPGA